MPGTDPRSAPFVVAIDGPAASGKGTIARRLAAHLGFAHLDTGRLYRAVGLAIVRAGGDPADPAVAVPAAHALDTGTLDDPDLSGDRAAQAASKVAAIGEVRAALLQIQRDFAARPPRRAPGAVLDGRDIGTVICPQADLKFFVTASPEVRAERRHRELLARGETSIFTKALAEMRERDRRDSTRTVAPLRPAEDAILIDTSELDTNGAFAAVLRHVAADTA